MKKLRYEFDHFVVYLQRYIEVQLQWTARLARLPYKSNEDRMEKIEWCVRNSEFISTEEVQKFLQSFREIYQSMNSPLRQDYISTSHDNDSIVFIVETLDKEMTKMEHQ